MRNLKKVLSLALAMVMLLGMMVVGAGAATEFKDADDITDNRKVAVAVSNTAGVLIGDAEGNFNPKDTLTRAEAAVILARLDLGADAAKALTATNAATFDDIGDGSGYGWAKAYIDYCYGNGYMIGVGGNRFAPGKTLTSVEFGLMVSRVLGYRDANEGITGSDWAVKAAALARKAGLGTDVPVNDQDMTRADMAQMVLNALTASMVEYEGLDITIGDVAITSKAKVRTHATDAGSSNRYTYDGESIKPNITPIRLCEEKFPDLRLKRDSLDVFGREYSQWTWKYVGITGSESEVNADSVYTKGTGATTVKADINDAHGYADTVVYINGKGFDGSSMNSTRIAKLTANGREVQVYLNKDNHKLIEKVVVVDTYAAKINSISKDGTDDRYVTVVTQDTKQTGPETPTTGLDKDDNVVNTALSKLDKTFKTQDFAAGDVVSYTAAWNYDDKVYEIQEMNKLEISATATLEKWVGKGLITSSDKGLSDSNFTAGGQKYDYSVNNAIVTEYGEYATNRIASFTAGKSEINIYLDEYGYVLYVSGVEAVKNYATVIGVGRSNQYGSETRGVTLLLPDGTTKEVIAKMDVDVWNKMSSKNVETGALTKGFDKNNTTENLYVDGIGDVVSYSVGANDIYTLVPASNPNYYHTYTDLGGYKVSFVSGKSLIGIGNTTEGAANSLYTTSKTIFMIGSPNSKGTSYNYSAYVGYASAPSIKWEKVTGVSYVTNSYYKNQIDAIYIDVEGVEAPTNYIYFVKAAKNSVTTTDFGSYSLSAVVDDEITTIEIKTALEKAWVDDKAATSLEDAPAGLYVIDKVVKDANGIITDCDVIELADAFKFTSGPMTGTIQRNGNVLGFGYANETTARYGAYTDSTKVYRIDEDYSEITAWNVESVPTDLNDVAYAQHNGATDPNERKLTNVFVKEVEGNVKPVRTFDVTVDNKTTVMTVTVDGKADAKTTVNEGTEVTIAVTGTVPADKTLSIMIGDQEYTDVGSWKITVNANVAVTVELKEKGAEPEIDDQFIGKVKVVDATTGEDLGWTVTTAKFATTAAAPVAVGDLVLGFTIPSGTTIDAADDVNILTANREYAVTARADFATSGAAGGSIDKTTLPAGTITGIEIPVTLDTVSYKVDVEVTGGGYILTGATTDSLEGASGTAADIDVLLRATSDDAKAFLSGVSEVKVSYSITNLAGETGPKTGFATGTVSGGVITIDPLLASQRANDKDVVVTITKIEGSKVAGEVKVADSISEIITDNTDSTVIATAAGHMADAELDLENTKLADFDLFGGAATGIKSIAVTYKLDGVTAKDGNQAQVTGTGVIAADGTLTLDGAVAGTPADANKATFTVNGDEKVVLTITGITSITLDKATAFGIAVAGEIDGQTPDTVAATTDVVLVLKDGAWVNDEAFVLDVSVDQAGGTANWTGNSKKGQIVAVTGATATTPVDSTNDTGTAAGSDALEFSFAKNAVTFTNLGDAVNIALIEKA